MIHIVDKIISDIRGESLNFLEKAELIRQLSDKHGMTQEAIAIRIGKSQPTVANSIRLLNLPQTVRDALIKNSLSQRHARALLKLYEEELQLKVLDIVIRKGYNIIQTEELVERAVQIEDRHTFAKKLNSDIVRAKKDGSKMDMITQDKGVYMEYTIKIYK